jgi:hypothetical protein
LNRLAPTYSVRWPSDDLRSVDVPFGSLTGVVTGFLTTGSFETVAPARAGRVPDGCLVPTEPLAHLVRGWVSDWNRDRPQTAGQFHADDDENLSPVRATAWLSENSGVPEATISRIMGRRSRMTELRIAEALVVGALERPDLFYDGEPPTLPIYPNPSAPIEARLSCCGGVSDLDYGMTGSGSW